MIWHTRKVRPETQDLGCLQVGPREPKMSRWDLGPPKVKPGTSNFLYFKSLILQLKLSLVTKLCIDLFIRLTYFRSSQYNV